MIAEITLKLPVSMWDILKVADRIKHEVFSNPDAWDLVNVSFDKLEFKQKQ